jgi:hypothetical protein
LRDGLAPNKKKENMVKTINMATCATAGVSAHDPESSGPSASAKLENLHGKTMEILGKTARGGVNSIGSAVCSLLFGYRRIAMNESINADAKKEQGIDLAARITAKLCEEGINLLCGTTEELCQVGREACSPVAQIIGDLSKKGIAEAAESLISDLPKKEIAK